MVEVVGIRVAASTSQHARAQDVGHAVRHQQRIAPTGDQRCKSLGNAKCPLGGGKQHHAAIRGDASAIERANDFLAFDGWETEAQPVIFGMTDVAASNSAEIGFDTQISASNQMLTLHLSVNPCYALNKMG